MTRRALLSAALAVGGALAKMSEWLYTEGLIIRIVYGDGRALRRLRALSRLRSRREVRKLIAAVNSAVAVGLDPAQIIEAWKRDKVATMQAYLARDAYPGSARGWRVRA